MSWLTNNERTVRRHAGYASTIMAGIAALLTHTTAIASDTKPHTSHSNPSVPALQSQRTDPTVCAKRYHAKLGSGILSKAEATLTMADEMRTPAAKMPGYWLFWDGSGVLARNARQRRLLASRQISIRDNRMCVRSILARGGRIRCLKWKPIPAGYVPPKPVLPPVDATRTEISAAERQIASRIASRVSRKGAFSELRHGTAFYHMAQRTSDELIAYANQPYRATICTGAKEMLGFYKHRLAPLTLKAARAKQLQEETHAAALATARAHLNSSINEVSHESNNSYSQIIQQLVKPVLTPHEYATLDTKADALMTLRRVRELVSDKRFGEIPRKQRRSLRKALRNIEFAHYARHNSYQWKRFSDAFKATFRAIEEASRSACGCSN